MGLVLPSRRNKKLHMQEAAQRKLALAHTTANAAAPAGPDPNKSLVLKFAMVAPVLIFVDQALAHNGASSLSRTGYQLFCLGLLYLILAPSRPGKPAVIPNPQLLAKRANETVITGSGGVFWKSPPGQHTIPAPRQSTPDAPIGSKAVYGQSPVDPVHIVPVTPTAEAAPAILASPAAEPYVFPPPPSQSKTSSTASISKPEAPAPRVAMPVKTPEASLPTPTASPVSVSALPKRQSIATLSSVPVPVETPSPPPRSLARSLSPESLPTTAAPVSETASVGSNKPSYPPPPSSYSDSRTSSPQTAASPAPSIGSSTSTLVTGPPPVKYLTEIEMMVKTLCHLRRDDSQWQLIKEKVNDPVTHSLSAHRTIPEAWKFEAEFKSTLEAAYHFMLDPSNRAEWDALTECQNVLRVFSVPEDGSTTRIQWVRTKGLFPTVARDSVVLFHGRRLGPNCAIVVQRGVEWNGEGIERADGIKVDVNIMGNLIERMENAADGSPRCRVTHIHDVNYHFSSQSPIAGTPASQLMVTMIGPQAIPRLADALEKHSVEYERNLHPAGDIIDKYGHEEETEEDAVVVDARPPSAAVEALKRSSRPPRISLPPSPPFNEMVSPLVLPGSEAGYFDDNVLGTVRQPTATHAATDLAGSATAAPGTHRYTENVEQITLDLMAQLDKRETSWKLIVSEDDIHVYSNPNGPFKIKVVAEMPGNVQMVFDAVSALDRHGRDGSVPELVEELDSMTKIYKNTTHATKDSSVIYSHTRTFDSGSMLGAFWAVDRDQHNPNTTMRASSPQTGELSGIFCERHPRDATRCVLTHLLADADVEGETGNLSRYVAAKALPAGIRKLRTILEDNEHRARKGKGPA
ncbi:hypothetical protein HDU87_008222 [Geranomyces variabilis]|uniref:START domain-containing protein n=1 Tax=Geranomyces variabilis TaxID=109894 RepID=A0AAD5XM90_9FUNG|nr:hypothetical protein HDU87_008222 [Geranomyces variabilis]